jgi:hypothetical protein
LVGALERLAAADRAAMRTRCAAFFEAEIEADVVRARLRAVLAAQLAARAARRARGAVAA